MTTETNRGLMALLLLAAHVHAGRLETGVTQGEGLHVAKARVALHFVGAEIIQDRRNGRKDSPLLEHHHRRLEGPVRTEVRRMGFDVLAPNEVKRTVIGSIVRSELG